MYSNDIENLLKDLAKNRVCKTGKRYLNGTKQDINTLIKAWRGWPEYLYEHSEFALSILRKYLNEESKYLLTKNLLFVDSHGTIRLTKNDAYPIYFLGDSDVTIEMEEFVTVKIYLFNSAKIMIRCRSNAYLNIETFDNSSVNIVNGENGKIIIYQYDKSKATGVAKVELKEYERGGIFNGKEIEQSKTYK